MIGRMVRVRRVKPSRTRTFGHRVGNPNDYGVPGPISLRRAEAAGFKPAPTLPLEEGEPAAALVWPVRSEGRLRSAAPPPVVVVRFAG